MPLSPRTRLGLFEIVTPIGAGGMGEVYRARDTKLGRDVAIKILPDAVAGDAERIARFEREAKALAALNHPNIATLFGLEQSEGRHLLVMELVDGVTLEEHIRARGAKGTEDGLAIDDVLAIALQITDALEAAHERGIVHRDLKPANIKITGDPLSVKVLDFGLAKALDSSSPAGSMGHAVSNSPTLSIMATGVGIILGTAAYMSPEQAKGLPTDHRSDIFSFGCVLFEMLAKQPAFNGESVSDILATVIKSEPDWSLLPAGLHPRLVELLKRCLAKSRRERYQAIGDVRIELAAIRRHDPIAASPAGVTTLAPRSPRWPLTLGVVAAAVAGIAVGAVAFNRRAPDPSPGPVRFELARPVENLTGQGLAIAPDGRSAILVGDQHLFFRQLSTFDSRPIPGIDRRSDNVAFAPDGRSFVFDTNRTLRSARLDGSAPVTIAELPAGPLGFSWNETGILVGLGSRGIVRVPERGGSLEQLVTIGEGESAAQPSLLPGNQAVLFTLASGTPPDWRASQVVVQRLGASEHHVLARTGSDARYLHTGHLVFAVDGVWMAAPFDLGTLSVTAPPVPVVEGVGRQSAAGLMGPAAMIGVSETGTLAYVVGLPSTTLGGRAVLLSDRAGTDRQLTLPDAVYEAPRVSPDGKQLALSSDDGRQAVVWIYDLSGASAIRRLTFAGRNRVPVWSPDGRRLAFQSDRDGDVAIFVQPADGSGVAERLTKADASTSHLPESWSSDGRYLSYSVVGANGIELWMYDFKEHQARPFAGVKGTGPANSAFSPDGRWIAYTLRDGPPAVFVQPVPATGARYQVSAITETGHHPFWSPSGKEFFYFGVNGSWLQAVPITLGAPPSIGVATRVGGYASNTTAQNPRNYDMTPDGRYFVRTRNEASLANQDYTTVRVVLNWFEELRQRVPVTR